jgi:exopolysaccharide biosynthesis protein
MKFRWVLLALIGFALVISSSIAYLPYVRAVQSNSQVRYDTIERSHYTIHTVTIPHDSNYLVVPEVGELQTIFEFAQQDNVIAAINGGYFDPVNQKTTSFIIKDSQIIADPRFNERLVDNPDLKPYLSKIFNRAELRRYDCGDETQYDIQLHFSPIPSNCTLKASLGGGPNLLPEDSSVAEGFVAYKGGEKIRDAIGSEGLNARSAVGITASEDVILVMVGQQSQQPLNSGISLPELADVLSELGAVKAMNLDGGSSASLYYNGQATYGRVDKEGNKIQRPIKSVLVVVTKE